MEETMNPQTQRPKRLACPVCRQEAGWRNPPELDAVTFVFDKSKERLRAFPIVCNNCGFVRFHDASKIEWGT